MDDEMMDDSAGRAAGMADFDGTNVSASGAADISGFDGTNDKKPTRKRKAADKSEKTPAKQSKTEDEGKAEKVHCKYCDKLCASKDSLRGHLWGIFTGKVQDKVGLHAAYILEKKQKDAADADAEKVLCEYCDKPYANNISRLSHLSAIRAGKEKDVDNLHAAHIREHKQMVADKKEKAAPRVTCEHCNKSYASNNTRNKHLANIRTGKEEDTDNLHADYLLQQQQKAAKKGTKTEAEKEAEKVTCQYCNKPFANENTLRTHLSTIRTGKEKDKNNLHAAHISEYEQKQKQKDDMEKYICEHCSAAYTNKDSLYQHLFKIRQGTEADKNGVHKAYIAAYNKKKSEDEQMKQHFCEHCKLGYKTKKKLNQHLSMVRSGATEDKNGVHKAHIAEYKQAQIQQRKHRNDRQSRLGQDERTLLLNEEYRQENKNFLERLESLFGSGVIDDDGFKGHVPQHDRFAKRTFTLGPSQMRTAMRNYSRVFRNHSEEVQQRTGDVTLMDVVYEDDDARIEERDGVPPDWVVVPQLEDLPFGWQELLDPDGETVFRHPEDDMITFVDIRRITQFDPIWEATPQSHYVSYRDPISGLQVFSDRQLDIVEDMENEDYVDIPEQRDGIRPSYRAAIIPDLGPLPTGWEQRRVETAGGYTHNRVYFVNNTTHSSTWIDPRLIPSDWTHACKEASYGESADADEDLRLRLQRSLWIAPSGNEILTIDDLRTEQGSTMDDHHYVDDLPPLSHRAPPPPPLFVNPPMAVAPTAMGEVPGGRNDYGFPLNPRLH